MAKPIDESLHLDHTVVLSLSLSILPTRFLGSAGKNSK
jgi:hypothetical protein